MKKIGIGGWDGKLADGTAVHETLVTILTYILNVGSESLPAGMEQFRFLKRMADALDVAEKSGTLTLEDKDCETLKDLLEKYVPARWAFHKAILAVIDDFMKL